MSHLHEEITNVLENIENTPLNNQIIEAVHKHLGSLNEDGSNAEEIAERVRQTAIDLMNENPAGSASEYMSAGNDIKNRIFEVI